MLKQHWDNVISTLKQRWNDVVQLWKSYIDNVQRWFNVVSTFYTDVVSTLCNVENPTSNFLSFSTSDQRSNGDPRCWSNVGSALKCWLVVSMKKLILTNILLATLLKNWNLYVFFKDYAKIFTTSVLTNFFWWLLLRIRLRLPVLNSSSLQQVPS